MKTAFVILAAGKGERLGGEPKQFRRLAGRPLWRWSLDCALSLQKSAQIDEIVLVLPTADTAEKLRAQLPEHTTVTAGGATRSLSVLAALRATEADAVLLHDAARPFVDASLCERLLSKFTGANAVIPLLPEANALKRISGGEITAMNRDGVFITQTPQLFPRLMLLRMLEHSADFSYKDEAELWLQQGEKLDWAEGSQINFKVTERGDWEMAQMLASRPDEIRNGLGYDVHPFVPGRPLVLGGVVIPSRLGLDGHSDADALTHAVADAVLSAAGLPDIGTLYPASDVRYKGICSMELLKDAVNRAESEGWDVDWISAVLTAQTPRLAPWKDQIVRSLEGVLGEGRVSVTFKSGEGIAPVGTAQAVCVWATATLKRPLPLS